MLLFVSISRFCDAMCDLVFLFHGIATMRVPASTMCMCVSVYVGFVEVRCMAYGISVISVIALKSLEGGVDDSKICKSCIGRQ